MCVRDNVILEVVNKSTSGATNNSIMNIFSRVVDDYLLLEACKKFILIRAPMNRSKLYFDPEKLVAYQRSVQFITWSSPLLENQSPKPAVFDQLDRASTSVPLNIAEGNAKYTAPDRCRYFDSARGSALECAACLDVLVAKRKM